MSATFQERLDLVNRRIASACAKAGRAVDEIRLVAVSKKHGPDRVREAAECGVTIFGENRVQEAGAKISMCPGRLTWHLVGHLQSNKARPAARLFDMIHSIDSLKLLEAVERGCQDEGKRMPVCIEVNVSGESSKFGLPPEKVPELLAASDRLHNVQIAGLMTMPPLTEDPEKARTHFLRLRELRDAWRAETGLPLDELSMGMSHDFEIAIEEGATLIRVGTALFGERGTT